MMKRNSVLLLACVLFSIAALRAQPPRLRVDDANHGLATEDGKPVFLIGDTAWNLARMVEREDVKYYLDTRRSQHFNTIGLAAIFENEGKNIYRDAPFEQINGKPDPTTPVTTMGNNPGDAEAYDYWDNLDFVLEEIALRNMYAALVISFNSWVVGNGNGEGRDQIVFDKPKSYAYGHWLGNRYKNQGNIIWMLGGDRAAVYGPYDYRDVYNAMAEGVADGINGKNKFDGQADYSGILMSFHPQKRNPNSASWFHDQPWLSFNSIQACPSDQMALVSDDYNLYPQKPVWLFEGRYENYTFDYKAWPVRFQSWLTVLAGGFGCMYGNEKTWKFANSWKEWLYDPGAMDMRHLYDFFNQQLGSYSLGDLMPEQSLLKIQDYGDVTGQCWGGDTKLAATATRIQAMIGRDGKLAVVYAANGRDIGIKRNMLKENFAGAYWYNPRNGLWTVPGEARDLYEKVAFTKQWPHNSTFDPPGAPAPDNDWVLLLEFE